MRGSPEVLTMVYAAIYKATPGATALPAIPSFGKCAAALGSESRRVCRVREPPCCLDLERFQYCMKHPSKVRSRSQRHLSDRFKRYQVRWRKVRLGRIFSRPTSHLPPLQLVHQLEFILRRSLLACVSAFSSIKSWCRENCVIPWSALICAEQCWHHSV